MIANTQNIKVQLYADGADIKQISVLANNPLIKGFTTNPSLMRAAGVTDYEQFARELLSLVPNHPISFEVFADELDLMEKQAQQIATWGKNVYVKIPVTNTKGESTVGIIRRLANAKIALNVTAILTLQQAQEVADALAVDTPAVVSIFAGRIADTGVDPIPLMIKAKEILRSKPKAELLWASTRELLNIFHAEQSGTDIITVPYNLLQRLDLIGKDLQEYSLDTVKIFYKDAVEAAFNINIPADVPA